MHPGVFVGLPKLDAVRRKIGDGEEPQATIYRWLTGAENRSLVNRKPIWDVYSGAVDTSKPCNPRNGHGCVMDAGYRGDGGREHTDLSKQNMSFLVNNTYANELRDYYSGGEDVYAQNAIRMLNAYWHTFKGLVSSFFNSYVGGLFAAWMSETLVRAAEIIRYTYVPAWGRRDRSTLRHSSRCCVPHSFLRSRTGLRTSITGAPVLLMV